MNCIHCDREIKNKGSLVAHQQTCKLNPNKVTHYRSPRAGRQKGKVYEVTENQKIASQKLAEFSKSKRRLDTDVFVENSDYARHHIKKRILEQNLIPYICDICKCLPIWMNKPMTLILDHKNGINNDNRISNLRFVCSNCDSQLSTYKSKNRKNKTLQNIT